MEILIRLDSGKWLEIRKEKDGPALITVRAQNGHQLHPLSVTRFSQVRDEQRKMKIVTVFQPPTEKDQGTVHSTWTASTHYILLMPSN